MSFGVSSDRLGAPPPCIERGVEDLQKGVISEAAIERLLSEGWMLDECDALREASKNRNDLFSLLVQAACQKESRNVLRLLPRDFMIGYRESLLKYMESLADCMLNFPNRESVEHPFVSIQLGALTDAQREFLSRRKWNLAEIQSLEESSTLSLFFETLVEIALSRGEIDLLSFLPKDLDDQVILRQIGAYYQASALELDVLQTHYPWWRLKDL